VLELVAEEGRAEGAVSILSVSLSCVDGENGLLCCLPSTCVEVKEPCHELQQLLVVRVVGQSSLC
jgi:hypothetical protein